MTIQDKLAAKKRQLAILTHRQIIANAEMRLLEMDIERPKVEEKIKESQKAIEEFEKDEPTGE